MWRLVRIRLTVPYDALNRVTQKSVPNSASGAAGYTVTYAYDLGNHQTSAFFGNGSGITNLYDGFGRLVSATTNMDGVNRTIASQYDADDNRTVVNASTGYWLGFNYDGLGRASSVQESGGSVVLHFGFDAFGRRSSIGMGPNGNNGSTVSYAYDGVGRLQNLSHDLSGSSVDQSIGFTYNPASQITTRTSSNDAYAWTGAVNVYRTYQANGLNGFVRPTWQGGQGGDTACR